MSILAKILHTMKRIMTIMLAISGLFLFAGCNCTDKCSSDKLNIIFETDMGNDVDDAMAMDMLYKYLDQDKINLLAVMINKSAAAPAEQRRSPGTHGQHGGADGRHTGRA